MALDVLKDCKEYVIQGIKSPGNYLISEFKNKKYQGKEITRFKHLLADDVVKCRYDKQISIGKTVAVKDKSGFYKGKVDDIFHRNGVTTCLILLLDFAKTVETSVENVYLIKDKKLRQESGNAFEISVHGIQPATLDVNGEDPFSSGIFHLRKSNIWSPSAFRFVKNLFSNNPYVFVKIIKHDKTISGEIYYIEDCLDWKPVSLGQKLCDEGFAVFSDSAVKSDDCNRGIEEKIPVNALSSDLTSPTTDDSTFTQRWFCKACLVKNDFSSSSTEDTVLENSKLDFMTPFDFNADKRSTSLSKANPPSSQSPSNSDDTVIKNSGNKSTEDIKLNVCSSAMRNLKLFNQQKCLSGAHC